jgi:hypothetical protein
MKIPKSIDVDLTVIKIKNLDNVSKLRILFNDYDEWSKLLSEEVAVFVDSDGDAIQVHEDYIIVLEAGGAILESLSNE